MRSRVNGRATALALAALGCAVAAIAGGLLLSRDDATPVHGDLIVYGCKEKGNPWYAICVMRSDGTGNERITHQLATTDPAWSPDGKRIAFTRNEDVGESTTYTSDDVFVMDADGDDLRRLTPERVGRSAGQPAWSPDGKRIAYVDGMSVNSAVPSRFGALFVMNDDGTDSTRLTEVVRGTHADTDPDWSPEGRQIAFTRGVHLSSPTDVNEDIYVLDLATGATRQLTRTPPGIFETAPAWSPDGSHIAFVRQTRTSEFDGKVRVLVMNRDGTGETRARKSALRVQSVQPGLESRRAHDCIRDVCRDRVHIDLGGRGERRLTPPADRLHEASGVDRRTDVAAGAGSSRLTPLLQLL